MAAGKFLVSLILHQAIIGSFTVGLQSPEVDSRILDLYKNVYSGDRRNVYCRTEPFHPVPDTDTGTYYGAGSNTGGLCQYFQPGLPPAGKHSSIRSTVALNKPQLFNSFGCGMCFKVHGSGDGSGNDPITGDFHVFVDNICPECHEGSLDFAEDGDGRWDINIQAAQCPVGNGNIGYKFQGSHQWYMKLQIRNHRIPITKMKLFQSSKKTWTPLKHSNDGFWELDPAESWHKPLDVPLLIQMTSANGVLLEDTIPKIVNGVVIPGNVQVPLDRNIISVPENSGNGSDGNSSVKPTATLR